MRRPVASTLGLALVFLLARVVSAYAEYRGTDLWSNVVPGGVGGLADRYPISHYALDYHVDAGITNPDGVPPTIAQWSASMLFMLVTGLFHVVLIAFDWAFNLDIVGGRNGALNPVGRSAQHLYTSNVVPLLVTAFTLLAAWMCTHVFARRFNDALIGALRAVVVLCRACHDLFHSHGVLHA